MATNQSWNLVLKLLTAEGVGVLGTTRQGHPYANLVAFAATDDARCIYFATARSTRKFGNLAANEKVAFLVDNRTNQAGYIFTAAAITAYGNATEVPAPERQEALALYLTRHPELKTFVSAVSTALFRISVTSYHLVQRFQHVTEFRMD